MGITVSEVAVFKRYIWLESHNFGNWNRIV